MADPGSTAPAVPDGCLAADDVVPPAADAMPLVVKWSGKEYPVHATADASLLELKRMIEAVTTVQPKRQKLLNVKKGGKPAADDAQLKDCGIKAGFKIMMIGTAEADVLAEPTEGSTEVVDDFDVPDGEAANLAVADRPENLAKLHKRMQAYKIKVLEPPRPGKKLLVLDVDYTLFDHRSPAETPLELARPYLHEFLSQSYNHYDIIIWSATSMKWVELKMKELGVLGHADYKIVALLDHGAMITVQAEKYGVFDCKPLQVIWAAFPGQYSPNNTIMFDDLSRNFAMNPQNGLKIRPFHTAHVNRTKDAELVRLTKYLRSIAALEDLSGLDHSRWSHYKSRS